MFATREGTPISRNTFRSRIWTPAVKASGVGYNVRIHDLRHAHASWLLAPEDLVVRKTLALFGRAEPRDYIDVYALNQRFDREATLGKAAEADQGFSQDVFVQALRAHRRIRDADLPEIGTPIEATRAYFDGWADELDGS